MAERSGRELHEYLELYPQAILNIGCGKGNPPECFGLDIEPHDGVDIVANAENKLPFEDNTFKHIAIILC